MLYFVILGLVLKNVALKPAHFHHFLKMIHVLSVLKSMPVLIATEGNLFNFPRSIAVDNIIHLRCQMLPSVIDLFVCHHRR